MTAQTAIRTQGPRVRVSPKNALALSMALHELATNAAKYGALSTSGGAVDVRWSLKENGGRPHLRLEWRESGGLKVEAPDRTGFGIRLIQQGLPAELGSEVEIDYDPQGLVCNMETPLPPQAR